MLRRVTLCQTVLQLVHRDTQPQLWVALQNQHAMSLAQYPQGVRADNLEQALEVYTRQAFPQEWARTQQNLGITYFAGMQGERIDNLVQAMHIYPQAHQLRTRQHFPEV